MKDHKTIEVVAVSYHGNVREFFCRDRTRANRIALFWHRIGAQIAQGTYVLKPLFAQR